MSDLKSTDHGEIRYIMIREDAVPEVYLKVLSVKEMLRHQPQLSVNQACKEAQLSRSAFYKYREMVHLYRSETGRTEATILLHAEFSSALWLRISEILYQNQAELRQFSQNSNSNAQALLHLQLSCPSALEVQEIENALRRVQGVANVKSILDL